MRDSETEKNQSLRDPDTDKGDIWKAINTLVDRLDKLQPPSGFGVPGSFKIASPEEIRHPSGRPHGETRSHAQTPTSSASLNFEDINSEFNAIRDTVTSVKLQADLKVPDNRQRVRREDQQQFSVVQKCAKFAETTLKLLWQIGDASQVTNEALKNIFNMQLVQIRYLQEEHSFIIVQNTCDKETSRYFRAFQRNSSGFSETAVKNLHHAAAISAATSRNFGSSFHRYPRARGTYRGFPKEQWRPVCKQGQLSTVHQQGYRSSTPDDCLWDLQWWIDALSSWNGTIIMPRQIDGQLETDSSEISWGAVHKNKNAASRWNKRISYKFSNYRELLTVLLALHSFVDDIHGKTIQILSDNITTVAYLNHMGGPNMELTEVATAIWSLCLDNNIMIVSRHLPGVQNIAADRLSRLQNYYEWKLYPGIFRVLDRMWGPHTVDRFASMETAQVPVYNSRYLDPVTSGVDALAQNNWQRHNNFVNPQFRLIEQALALIKAQKASATVIAPLWPAQPWYQDLMSLSIARRLKLPPIHLICRGIRQQRIEPLQNPKWKRYAWRVCGDLD